ncbi:MAG: sigma-70 family RNA polymerase sigma factor [Planctomycetota bacterium]|nr:sigma-70 family RNA polymerase sigma factor [Planctomycetota bacterium]
MTHLARSRERDRMKDSLSDQELLLPRIARGEADAVQACITRYGPLVWSLSKRLTRDVAALEDLVQEIFIAIWKNAGSFDSNLGSESTFIATIARRKVIDRHRRTQRAPKTQVLEETSMTGEEAGFARIDLGDDARRAQEVLAQLRPEQRRLILMSVVQGLTHQEIAASTGIPLGTIKSHIRRGLERAAQVLRPSEGGASS